MKLHPLVKKSLYKYLASKNKLVWSHTFEKETNFSIFKRGVFITF